MIHSEKALKLMEGARQYALINFPMFTRMLLETTIVEDYDIDTLATNGKVIKYNPNFVKSIPSSDVAAAYMHEVMHMFFGHPLRFDPDKYDEEDFQLAADYVTNAALKEAKVNVPPYFYYNFKFHHLSLQEVYDIIHQDKNETFDRSNHGVVEESPDVQDDQDGQNGQGDKDSQDPCQANDPNIGREKRERAIQEHENKMRSDIQSAMMMGHMNNDLSRYVTELFKSETNWKDILAETMVRCTGRDDFTYQRPSRRYSQADFIYPGMYSEESGTLAIFVDTSISVSDDQLNRMASEVLAIAEDVTPERIIVIGCSTQVNVVLDFEPGDEVDMDLKGRGGTDFRPPFKKLEEMGIEPITALYLTDGLCNKFPDAPDYPVIWVIWQDRNKTTQPFGEQVVMEGWQ